MNPFAVLGLLLLLAAGVGSAVVLHRTRIRPAAPRWLLAALPISTAIGIWLGVIWTCNTPYDEWTGARVAAVLAWTMGYPLYFPPGEGPASAFMYPPVSAVLRLPAVLASTPNSAIIFASALNAVIFFVPMVVYARWLRGRSAMRWIALLVMFGITLNVSSLVYSAFKAHADAPAVGFALLGCACLSRRGRKGATTPMLLLAAACGVLSVGSKQTTLPVLIILPLFAALRHGRRAGIVTSLATILLLVLGVGFAVTAFGYAPLKYNLWDIAAKQPWWFQDLGVVACLLLWSGTLLNDAAIPATVLAAMVLLVPPVRPRSVRAWLARNPWLLPLAIAIVFVPFSILGVAKRGGVQNSLTLTSYFLVAAIGGMVLSLRPSRTPRGLIPALTMLAVALPLVALSPFTQKYLLVGELGRLSESPQMLAYRYTALHSGRVYFPRHPLAGLMVDGKFYLYEYGWTDMIAAGETPPIQRMFAWMPKRTEMVAFPPTVVKELGMITVPGFTQRIEVPELPGWYVFIPQGRSGSAPGSP